MACSISIRDTGSYRHLGGDLYEVRIQLELVGQATDLIIETFANGTYTPTSTVFAASGKEITTQELATIDRLTVHTRLCIAMVNPNTVRATAHSAETFCSYKVVQLLPSTSSEGITRQNSRITQERASEKNRLKHSQVVPTDLSATDIASNNHTNSSGASSTDLRVTLPTTLPGWEIPKKHFYSFTKDPKQLYLGDPFFIYGPLLAKTELRLIVNDIHETKVQPYFVEYTIVNGVLYGYHCVNHKSVELGKEGTCDPHHNTYKLQIWIQGEACIETPIK